MHIKNCKKLELISARNENQSYKILVTPSCKLNFFVWRGKVFH